MARVLVEGADKTYPDGVHAIRRFDLEAADGEVLAVVGPSGSGKTTLLRLIAGLERPTRGRILIGSRTVDHLRPKDRNVAMVFQGQVLYPHLTAYGNMAFGLKLRRESRTQIDREVQRAAAALGIEPLLDRMPRQLSGGERQRVAVGRALVRRPDAFLFDEPLSHLDARTRRRLQSELKSLLARLQTTTIYVTHDQQEAMTLGQRIALVRAGRLEQVGTPADVFRHPANRFVAEFLGDDPMNFLDGTLERTGKQLWFNEGAQRIAVPDWAHASLSDRVGGCVVLGIRPERISPAPLPQQGDNALRVKVNATESLGETLRAHLATEHQTHLIARPQPHHGFTIGEVRSVYLDLDHVYFFPPAATAPGPPGTNLCLAAEKQHFSCDVSP